MGENEVTWDSILNTITDTLNYISVLLANLGPRLGDRQVGGIGLGEGSSAVGAIKSIGDFISDTFSAAWTALENGFYVVMDAIKLAFLRTLIVMAEAMAASPVLGSACAAEWRPVSCACK